MSDSEPVKATVRAKRVLAPLASYGFDPTESAVPWSRLRLAGHTVTFATPDGAPGEADRRMVTGEELPHLLRKTLQATPDAVRLYRLMESSPEFRAPISYAAIEVEAFDALLLPGGHDKGMRVYLEHPVLQARVAEFFAAGKPVAAICHGTLLAARSRRRDDRSVLWGRKTTGLTRGQELAAWWMTRATLGDYYRTYQMPMADELRSNLRSPADYDPGPGFPIPLGRDSERDLSAGFTVRDGNYLSARWPGDAYSFSQALLAMLEEEA
ncbi:MAG TPA: type 1 glutamine amidotransferase domain-containing protein [Thermoanaerobaculia bacterium]